MDPDPEPRTLLTQKCRSGRRWSSRPTSNKDSRYRKKKQKHLQMYSFHLFCVIEAVTCLFKVQRCLSLRLECVDVLFSPYKLINDSQWDGSQSAAGKRIISITSLLFAKWNIATRWMRTSDTCGKTSGCSNAKPTVVLILTYKHTVATFDFFFSFQFTNFRSRGNLSVLSQTITHFYCTLPPLSTVLLFCGGIKQYSGTEQRTANVN